jgi:hypothetical protein
MDMNADGSALLAQLHDIHGTGQPGWWPPAPGWWVLAVVLLLLAAFVLRKILNWQMVHRRRKAWLRALDELNTEHDPVQQPHEYLAAVNRLFRAVAVKAFPDTACARLQGDEWVAFIVSLMPEQEAADCLGVLASGPYESLPRFEASSLIASANTWVKLYG